MNERTIVGDRVAIYPRGKRGIYQADYHYRGRHRRESLKTSNRKIAIQRATALAAKIYEGTLDEITKPSTKTGRKKLWDAITDYRNAKKASGLRPKTIQKYHGTLVSFSDFATQKGVLYLDGIRLVLLDAYEALRNQTEVRGKKLSAKQKYHDLSLLKRFFEWCVERDYIAVNPLKAKRITSPTPRRRLFIPTITDVDQILKALPKRIHAPVAMLAFGGMRSSNCRNLLVSDVNFDGNWIEVRSRDGAETKVGNEWKVPLHPRLRKILKSLRPADSGYFFTAPPSQEYPSGDHWINTKHLNDDFVRVVRKLGMPAGRDTGYTLHSLRHFFKSFCLSHGVPREYVDGWQGHTSIKTASDLYVHTYDAESQRLMALVPFGDGEPAADAGEEELNNEG